jgi:hypothetical protein
MFYLFKWLSPPKLSTLFFLKFGFWVLWSYRFFQVSYVFFILSLVSFIWMVCALLKYTCQRKNFSYLSVVPSQVLELSHALSIWWLLFNHRFRTKYKWFEAWRNHGIVHGLGKYTNWDYRNMNQIRLSLCIPTWLFF